MCEIYVRVVDRPENPQLMQRGDVIHVGEDGHPWGKKEVASTQHRIIKLPGVPAKDLDYLLMPDVPEQSSSEPRHKRGVKLDLDALAITADTSAVRRTARTVDTLEVKQITEVEKPVDPSEPDGEKYLDKIVEWEPKLVEIQALEPVTRLTAKQVQTATVVKEFR